MKKNIRFVLILTAIALLALSALGLIACNNDDIVELRVENAKISFMKGDVFETGEGFAVYAVYKDGKTVDVTEEAEIRRENGMDMNVVGDYQITVVYGSKREIYVVYVNDSEDVLRKIEADTSSVKKQYKLGDKLSLDNIEITLTYENAQNVAFPVKTSSLVGLDVVLTRNGQIVENQVFDSMGKFTVTLSKGNVKTSFDVTVDGVNIADAQGAITVGGYYKNTVLEGDILVQGAYLRYGEESGLQPGEPYTANIYEFKFGDNYTYFKEDYNEHMEYHCAVDDKGFFVTYLENGQLRHKTGNEEMMNGAPISLWYSNDTEYGAENALKNLYAHALVCTNGDLKETVNESTREYSFAFSGLEFRDNGYDYYETTVTFRLSQNYAVEYLKIDQYYYEDNSSLSQLEDYKPSYITDPDTGKTTPGEEYTYRTIITLNQTSGERTATNKYNREMFKVTSYNLEYDGNTLDDESVIELNAGNHNYTIKITDLQPSTANLTVDAIYFDFDGNRDRPGDFLSNEHFVIRLENNEIKITAWHGGTWTIYLRTEQTEKKINLNITGEDPAEMNPKLYNAVSKTFYDGSDKTLSIGGTAYFYGAVENYANAEQEWTINSGNGEYATITADNVNGIDCWKFTATQAGTYQITVTSTIASLTNCIFTFTVNDAVDFVDLLSGTYAVQDRVGDIYRVTFTLTDEQALEGKATVTRTPTDEDNNPLPDKAVEQEIEFYVDGMEIVVKHSDGEDIYVDFAVNDDNKLELVDQRENRYELIREE